MAVWITDAFRERLDDLLRANTMSFSFADAAPTETAADCPHPIDSPEGREWLRDLASRHSSRAYVDPDHPKRREQDERMRHVFGDKWDQPRQRPDTPDPADPAYLDHLAAEMLIDEVDSSVSAFRYAPGSCTITISPSQIDPEPVTYNVKGFNITGIDITVDDEVDE